MHDKTLGAMLPLLMLLLLLFLPVLIKLGNPLSRQKRGAPRFIIKEERDTAANIAPVNEKYNGVLQDVEISITWQSAPTHPVRRVIRTPLRLPASPLFCRAEVLSERQMEFNSLQGCFYFCFPVF